MTWLITLIEFTRNILTGSLQVCNASVFHTPGDKWAGGTLRCVQRLPRKNEMGIAHRTLPCGTGVIIFNPRTNKWAGAVVVDRGPYGAIHEGQWVLKRRAKDPGKWRGGVDLLPAVARQIQHNGMERIILKRVR